MVNLNIYGRDWRQNLKQKPKENPVTIDHDTGKVISQKKIDDATRDAWLKVMMAMAKQHQGL